MPAKFYKIVLPFFVITALYVAAYTFLNWFLYLAAIVASALASAYHNWNEVAIGASGAVMGLFAAFYVLVLTKSVRQKISALFIWTLFTFTLINFSLGFLYEGIDNAAHVGGLAAGIVIGFAYIPFVRKRIVENEEN